MASSGMAFAQGGTATTITPSSDIQISGSASTGSPNPGSAYTYTFQIKNSGPNDASSAVFTDTLPGGIVYNNATVNGATSACTSVNDGTGIITVSCELGTITKGSQSIVIVSLNAPTIAGTFSNTGIAVSSVNDPLPANNAVTVSIQVKAGATTTPISVNSQIAYTNFGVTPPTNFVGWAVTGLQKTGFFNYDAEQFMSAFTGTVSKITIPIHQYDTGGNGSFVLKIYDDNPNSPNTLGSLIATYNGQSIRTGSTSTVAPVINVTNGVKLIAGQTYWAEIIPSSDSRESWAINDQNITGIHYENSTTNSEVYTPAQFQGAFEIEVLP